MTADRTGPRPVAGRLPPNDQGAQRATLAACLLAAEAVDEVVGACSPADFYGDGDRAIAEMIFELHASGQPVDIVTVAGALQARETLAAVGGPGYLAELADATPAVAHVAAHARIVRLRAKERRMIATCQRVAAEGYFEHPADWLETSAAEIEAVATAGAESAGDWMSGALRGTFEDLQTALTRGGLLGWSTGLRDLDRRLGGLLPGGVTVVGGRPGMGKTALAFKIAEAVAGQAPGGAKLGACVFSLEMPRKDLARRQTFTRAMVDAEPLKTGRDPGTAAWGRLAQAATELAALPLWIDDTPALSPLQLRARARQVRAEMKRRGVRLALVVVDYLQLMNGRAGMPRGANREQEVAECSKKLKELAKELDVHVVALSQLNRSVEGRTVKDRRPRMADLRESGSVEQDADNIVLLYRDEQYNPDTDRKGIAELLIEKQRAGAVGVCLAKFTAWCTRFDDLEGAAPAWDRRQGPED